MEKNIRQKDENVNVRVDQIKHDVEEELRNMQVLTKTSLGENIDSINDKIRTEIIEMDIKMKSLDVKIEQNFDKNNESSNNVAQTVKELSKSQNENLLSLKSEMFNKIDETKTTLGENIESTDNKIGAKLNEVDLKMKSLEVKIEENFEKNMESSNNVVQTVQELSKSQVENLLSLKSEISNKIDETDHHNKSLISNIEERLVTDTETKIAQLGKSL